MVILRPGPACSKSGRLALVHIRHYGKIIRGGGTIINAPLTRSLRPVYMAHMTDRCGRKIRLFLYDASGGRNELSGVRLDTALRIKRSISRAAEKAARPGEAGSRAHTLCDQAIIKILGLRPVRAGIELWGGRALALGVPADIANFLSDLSGIIKENQYNYENFKNAVIIDAGANIGLFSLYACARGAKKVYAFEPVRETYAMLKNNIAANSLGKAITVVNAALGAKRGEAKIKCCTKGEGSAMIAGGNAGVNEGLNYEAVRGVKVLALDDIIRRKVDLIKIDVEGYEKQVLLGAAGLIKAYKPVLSFSAYHRSTDKKTLPRVVLGLRKDYRIVLNTFAEHDFYCD